MSSRGVGASSIPCKACGVSVCSKENQGGDTTKKQGRECLETNPMAWGRRHWVLFFLLFFLFYWALLRRTIAFSLFFFSLMPATSPLSNQSPSSARHG